MKLLQINSVCGIRSTGRICTDIADVLESQEHTCKIAYGRETVPEKYQKYAVRIGNGVDVRLHALSARFLDNAGFASKRVTKRFINWVKDYDPDVIHLHNIHGYYLNVELLFDYLKQADKTVIWTLHDCWPFTGHCAYFDFAGCDKWKMQCADCPQKSSYPRSFTDRSKRNYEKKKKLFTDVKNLTIVTPSRWLASLVKKSSLQEYPVEVIHNGIDLAVFKPIEGDFRIRYHMENKKIILGVASVWDSRKGLQDFVRLAALLDETYQIVLVGLSEEQKHDLPDNILGITRTNNTKELAEIYTAADIFVNPTHEDNYPTTNLEALACGTPVITYATGGSPEILDESCGIVVDANVRELVYAIQTFDYGRYNKEHCLKRAALFHKTDRFEHYLNLYHAMNVR